MPVKKKRQPKFKTEPPQVELYFDTRDGSYWYKIHGRHVSLKKADIMLHLQTLGLRDDTYVPAATGSLREIDFPFYDAMQNRLIDYAGSLGGHRAGVFRDGARCYLVTDEPSGVWLDLPKKVKEPKFFKAFVEELLPGDQHLRFCYWLSIALRSLRRGDFMPGQAIIFAGPAKSGKSLCQTMVTDILGGRPANPTQYMFKETKFNYDLAGAEHWVIEDPRTTTDMRTRKDFGEAIKEATVNRLFAIHRKNKDPLFLPIFRRITISVNDETENIAVCPPFNPSVVDKIFLFKCATVSEALSPFRGVEGQGTLLPEVIHEGELDQRRMIEAFRAEVPMIRAWLLSQFRRVPADQRDDRFGIVAWQHPDLLAELSELSQEVRFQHLIDQVFWSEEPPHVTWTGKAIELEAKLQESNFAFEASKLLKFAGNCGAHLGKLSRHTNGRVAKRVIHGHTIWTIKPPVAMENDDAEEPSEQ